MNEETLGSENLIILVQSPLQFLLAMITRPVVQRQVAAVVLIMVVAWLLPEGIRLLNRRLAARKRRASGSTTAQPTVREHSWQTASFWLMKPILAIVLLWLSITLFERMGYPNGLLQDLVTLIWIWLAYRGLITLLYARYGAAVRPYQSRIITPIFLFIIGARALRVLPGADIWGARIGLGDFVLPLGSLLAALVILYVFVVGAWVLEQLMMRTLPTRLNTEPGVVESVATLTRYALLSLGIVIALASLGLDLSSLAIVAGGLSVGIGIGLQEIVSNFVSGLALLFEQSLRPGDVVELNGRISTVEKVSLRATTIRTRTNEEVIVPNNNFTQSQVTNLTKTDRLVQITVPIGVSYASDVALVRRLAVATAAEHPLVLPDPAPDLMFVGYGESSLDFNLLVSTHQPALTFRIRSDLYYLLWTAFAEHEIVIPFPQRDLNLGSGWDRVGSELQSPA